MTSKNLFFNLMKEDLKRRLWSIVLFCVMFAFLLPIAVGMMLSIAKVENVGNIGHVTRIVRYLRPQLLMCAVTVGCSMICGMNGFFYLHSTQKVDLYHSIPVKREKLFAVHYMNGILIYAIPYLVCTLIATFIAAQSDLFAGDIAKLVTAACMGFGVNLAFYLVLYSVMVLAMLLTGNLIVGAGVFAIFCGYGPFIVVLKELMFGTFFDTYAEISERTMFLLSRTSPLTWYCVLVAKISDFMVAIGAKPLPSVGGTILAICAIAVLVTVICLVVYRFRPSEGVGNALAFTKAEPVLKVLLTVPAALFCGVFFRNITGGVQYSGWYVFGLISGVLAVHSLIEMLFHFDFRAVFHGKKSLAVSTVLVAAIVCIFQFDLLGYDTWIPKEKNIAYMAMQNSTLDEGTEINKKVYFLNDMQVKDFDAFYELAKLGAKFQGVEFEDENAFESYRIGYQLKNGRKVYRSYQVPRENASAFYETVYDNPEYRESLFPILKENPEEVLAANTNILNHYQRLSVMRKTEMIRLLETYQKELREFTYEDLKKSRMNSRLQFATKSFAEKNYPDDFDEIQVYTDLTPEYPVYECFTETLEILQNTKQKTGFTDFEKEVEWIEIGFPSKEAWEDKDKIEPFIGKRYAEKMRGKYGGPSIRYTDPDQIEEILEAMAFYGDYPQQAMEDEAGFYIKVLFDFDNDQYGYFPAGKIPEFLKNWVHGNVK